MAEGGGEKSRCENLFFIAVDMGLLADEGVISVTQMCAEGRIAYGNLMKKQRVLLQTVYQVCVPLYFRSVQCFYIPSIIRV